MSDDEGWGQGRHFGWRGNDSEQVMLCLYTFLAWMDLGKDFLI